MRAAAGVPRPVFDEEAGFGIAIHRSVLPGWARADCLICISAAGDSMETALRDGDLVALDYSKTEPTDGRLFVVRTEDGLVVKRLRGRPGAWTLTSNNPRYRLTLAMITLSLRLTESASASPIHSVNPDSSYSGEWRCKDKSFGSGLTLHPRGRSPEIALPAAPTNVMATSTVTAIVQRESVD